MTLLRQLADDSWYDRRYLGDRCIREVELGNNSTELIWGSVAKVDAVHYHQFPRYCCCSLCL